jgi:hypothetical protein
MPKTLAKRKKSKVRTRTVATPVEPQIQGSGRGKILALFVFLSVFLAISVLFLIGDILSEPGTNRNLFGPYAAKFADTQLCLFGPLPLTFLLLSCFCLIIWFYLKKISKSPRKTILSYGHYAFGFVLLYVFFSIILAIIMPDILKNVPLSIKTVSREYSGLIGLFLAKRVFPHIFGQDTGGLLYCSYLGVIMTAFCFGLKPRHLIELTKKIKFGVQTMLYNFDFAREKPKVTIYVRQPDTGDFVAVRLGEVRPAKGSPFGKQEKEDLSINKDHFISDAETQIISAEESESPTDVIERIDREIKRATDPREVRRLRDELAEYKRIEAMNKWEDVKGGELKIEGLLGKR